MLSKKNKEALFNPLSKDNPVLVQILGPSPPVWSPPS